ncbi:UDP-N-acetylmuramoyl-L-alanine--D-glutamate ligase [Hydrogenobaculum acidophilum]
MAYLVWGKGRSGLAAFNLLKAKGFEVIIGDDKEDKNLWREVWGSVDIVVLSPGIPPSHPLWQEALKSSKEIIGETELAYRFYKGKNIIAVTGTDGKSTTVHLIHHFTGLKEGGNFGTPFSEIVLENDEESVVLEVSSFQGKTLKTFRPNIGAFLNFSKDHLDWHKDMEDYLLSKQSIFKNQTKEDILILNAKKPVSETPSFAKKVFFGEEGNLKVIGNDIYYNDEAFIKDIYHPSLKGIHNLYNIAVASFVAFSMGVEIDKIKERLNTFEGLPFRYQYLGNFDGVDIYNDSKSTTVNALMSALESTKAPIVLIAGGIDKGGDFLSLSIYKDKIKMVFLYGKDKNLIKDQIESFLKVCVMDNLEDALIKAKNEVNKGDTILFSPACASFDMFENYKHRGEIFNALVKKHFSSL